MGGDRPRGRRAAEHAHQDRRAPNSHLIEVGHKGMYVVVVGLYKNGPTPFRYQRVPLDHRFADAPEIDAMHVEYQKRLETLGTRRVGARSRARIRRAASSPAARRAPTATLSATEVYVNTPHSHATETLVESQAAAAFRSRVPELPRDRLGAAEVFSV